MSASTEPDWSRLTDLASREFGGAVIAANDELFAEKENLIKPGAAEAYVHFGNRGGAFDGWETRRRRTFDGPDWAVVRLGLPGVVRGVVVDTAHFTGNHPAEISVDAAHFTGYPSAADVAASDAWEPLVERSVCKGDTTNPYAVADGRRWTHLRLNIHPDGGVARFRVHGEVLPDPKWLAHGLDLAALENGGHVTACSDRFYCDPGLMLRPGVPVHMDGWETRRRRDAANDWATVRLAGRGVVRQVEIDTTYNVGNAPGAARLLAVDATTADPADPDAWWELLPRTELQPDTRHRFRPAPEAADRPATDVRFDIYPDGGVARMRLHGELTPSGLNRLTRTFLDHLPEGTR